MYKQHKNNKFIMFLDNFIIMSINDIMYIILYHYSNKIHHYMFDLFSNYNMYNFKHNIYYHMKLNLQIIYFSTFQHIFILHLFH